MQTADQDSRSRHSQSFWFHPLFYTAIALLLVLAGLSLKFSLPIGPSYWDLSIFLDAAHRIANGQIPNSDFLTPAGPLEYYQFYLINKIFPGAHPLLSTQWSILIVALPLFVLLILATDKISRTLSLLLTLPFLCFALLPLNTEAAYPAPGFDGYGVYNRHPALLLYILAAALLFIPGRKRLHLIVAAAIVCLFFSKITGFVTGVLLVAYALAAGRIRLRDTAITAAAVLVLLALVELAAGIVSNYLINVMQLAALNQGSFPQRFPSFAGLHLDIFLPLGVAALALAFAESRRTFNQAPETPLIARFQVFLDSKAAWLLAVPAAAIVFEIQNTGSQEFIYAWPAVLLVLRHSWRKEHRYRTVVIVALAVAGIPLITGILHRAMRALLSSASYQALAAPELGPLGRINARPVFFIRAEALNQHFFETRAAQRKLAERGVSHSDMLASEPDFQIAWLINTAAAVRAIQAFEANTGRRLESIFSLDFTDPFSYLLGRRPIRFVQIGLDAQRTLLRDDKRMIASVASADGILIPQCPLTPMREAIIKAFEPALEGRQRIALTPCWDLLIRNGSDFAQAP